jgi:5-bromo-4-chloroindolyl phosphate hydrolysis protein
MEKKIEKKEESRSTLSFLRWSELGNIIMTYLLLIMSIVILHRVKGVSEQVGDVYRKISNIEKYVREIDQEVSWSRSDIGVVRSKLEEMEERIKGIEIDIMFNNSKTEWYEDK